MKRLLRFMVVMAVLAAVLTGFASLSNTASAAGSGGKLELDLVIVIDQSNSMYNRENPSGSNDPEGFRMDAAEAMLALCDMDSSRAALVLFHGQVIEKESYLNSFFDISMTGSNNNRSSMIGKLKEMTTKVSGDTDIGAALQKAVEIIRKDPSPRQPVILLLTDGGIDVRHTEGRNDTLSAQDFENAVAYAEQNGVKIYTVALSGPGGRDYETNLLQNASQRTGGLFRPVENVADLPKVFNSIFANEIESEVISLKAETFPMENGWRRVRITVPNQSVVEANIMVATDSECRLYAPGSGVPVEVDGQNIASFSTGHFAVYKIVRPKKTGDWYLEYKPGKNQENADINIVFSYNVTPVMGVSPAENLAKNDTVTVTVEFVDENGQPSTDAALYQTRDSGEGIQATLTFLDERGEHVYKTGILMEGRENRFELPLNLAQIGTGLLPAGTYTIRADLKGDGMNTVAEACAVTIRNRAPVAKGERNLSEAMVIHDPTAANYDQEATIEIDLSELFEEPEGEAMWYTISSQTDESAVDAAISGSILSVTTKDRTAQTTLQLSAVDPDGDYDSVYLTVDVTSVRDALKAECALRVNEPEAAALGKETDLTLTAALTRAGQPVTDQALLELAQPRLTLSVSGEEPAPLDFTLNPATGLFEAVIHTREASASYQVSGSATLRNFDIAVQGAAFSVGNVPPEVVAEAVEALPARYEIDPFWWRQLDERELTVALAECFRDTPDDELTFAAYRLTEEQRALSDEELLSDPAALEALPLSDEGTALRLENADPGSHELLLTAVDSDDLRVAARYGYQVISQRAEVIRLIVLAVLSLIAFVILALLFYWRIVRRPWKPSFGAVRPEVGGSSKRERTFPVRGRRETQLSSMVSAAEIAEKESPLYKAVTAAGKNCLMRPMRGDAVQVRVVANLPAGASVKIGSKTITRKGQKALWTRGGVLSVSMNGVSAPVTLNRVAASKPQAVPGRRTPSGANPYSVKS